MDKYSFISSKYFFLLVILCYFAFSFSLWIVLFIFTLAFISMALLFKKKLRIDSMERKGFYSPVSGYLSEIKYGDDDSILLRIITPLYVHYGVYSPCRSEVLEVSIQNLESRSHFRYATPKERKYPFTLLKMVEEGKKEFSLRLYPCLFSSRAQLYIESGDCPQGSANIGYFPFGGMVEIILESTEIIVKEGERVFAGETLLVGNYAK